MFTIIIDCLNDSHPHSLTGYDEIYIRFMISVYD